MEQQDKRFEKYEKEIEPRVKKLFDDGFMIEAYILMATAFENELIGLIFASEKYIKTATQFCWSDKVVDLACSRGKKMTLGQWAHLLKVHGFKEDLIKEVGFFVDLRNECAHRLLDSNVQDLNINIKINYSRFNNLMCTIIKEHTRILLQETDLLKKSIEILKSQNVII